MAAAPPQVTSRGHWREDGRRGDKARGETRGGTEGEGGSQVRAGGGGTTIGKKGRGRERCLHARELLTGSRI